MRVPAILTKTPKVKKCWLDRRDPQVHKVYLMERYFIGSTVLTSHPLKYLKAVAKHACTKWNVKVPKIVTYRDVPRGGHSDLKGVYGFATNKAIYLNSGDVHGKNLQTLLHELAHWISDHTYGYEAEPHGAEFMSVYAKLLDAYKMMPEYAFRAMCKNHDIEILDD